MKAAVALVIALAAIPAWAQVRDVPDPQLTPGAVATTDQADVCAVENGLTYSKRHRLSQNEQTKRLVLQRYGVPWSDRARVEDDHIIPLCAGGSDDTANRWPQYREGVTWKSGDKDLLEAAGCRALCGSHTMTLQQVQALFMPDWRVAFCGFWPDDPRCAELRQ